MIPCENHSNKKKIEVYKNLKIITVALFLLWLYFQTDLDIMKVT